MQQNKVIVVKKTQNMANAKTIDYQDSYSANLPTKEPSLTIEEVGRGFFSTAPSWLKKLFMLRNKLVKFIGLKVGKEAEDREAMLAAYNFEVGEAFGLFKVFQKSDNALIIGADDKHLDFRVSLLIDRSATEKEKLTITTTVYFHNWTGRLYFIPVKPFHSLAVPAMLRSIVKKLKK